ncbi:hypothetical protein ACIBG0_38770 [Nocardia sp. NPDC050630]|uniref:hypothetical protein n=1 Tax=Nocardia sp. NPDC050630 TaxID=3364321 RepID=UPI0037887B12
MARQFHFFERLPKQSRPRPLLEEFANALYEERPKWALWPRPLLPASANVVPGRVNRGLYKTFPKGWFEAVERDGKVYVRYVGPAPVDADEDETVDEYDGDAPVRPGSDPDPDDARDRVIDTASGVI